MLQLEFDAADLRKGLRTTTYSFRIHLPGVGDHRAADLVKGGYLSFNSAVEDAREWISVVDYFRDEDLWGAPTFTLWVDNETEHTHTELGTPTPSDWRQEAEPSECPDVNEIVIQFLIQAAYQSPQSDE